MALTSLTLAPAKKLAKNLCLTALAAGLAVGLSACGQRGPLVPPSAKTPDAGIEGQSAPATTNDNPNVPDEGFVLDPLL
nr:lipoprotein [uncultured Cohaesibacter sp.]